MNLKKDNNLKIKKKKKLNIKKSQLNKKNNKKNKKNVNEQISKSKIPFIPK